MYHPIRRKRMRTTQKDLAAFRASAEKLFGKPCGCGRGRPHKCHHLKDSESKNILDKQARLGDRVMAVAIDAKDEAVVVVTGRLKKGSDSFSNFQVSGNGKKPDFTRPSVSDWGWTVKLGQYESAAEAILWDFKDSMRKKRQKR